MIGRIGQRWSAKGGYREFLRIAVPLILSTAIWSVQQFVDRIFLTWYSTDALAAALPAGMVSFTVLSFFMGTAGYVNTFVAQYVGARKFQRVGPAVWQGIYLGLISGLVGLLLAALAVPLFDLVGHDPVVRIEEIEYFRILCYATGPQVISTALSCFFSGRGQTWIILIVNLSAIVLNITADYVLIFGCWGMPEMGIRGAAWATDLSSVFSALFFGIFFLHPEHRRRCATLKGWKLDPALLRRLLRFGGPNGLNFMLDVLAFTLFLLFVGRLGTVELAATNLAFNINSLAFMPLVGGGIAISTLVGQRLGENDPDGAEYCTWTGLHLALLYMGGMALGYLFFPDVFLIPFEVRAQGAGFEAARRIAVDLLRIVVLYCLFDALYIIFTSALKGAGDTRFIMQVSVVLAWSLMVVPSFLALRFFGAGLYLLWAFVCAYIIAAGGVFYLRFRTGKWRDMRVIEDRDLSEEGTAE